MSESASEKKALQREFRRAIALAEKGDAAGVAVLTKMLAEHPDSASRLPDLATLAEDAFLNLLSSCPATRVAFRHQLAEMRKGLEDPLTTPLERLLIAQVVVSWAWANHADHQVASMLRVSGSANLTKHYQRAQERAARRHVAAVKALIQARRLLVPRSGSDLAARAPRPAAACR